MSQLKQKYRNEIRNKLHDEFKYENPMQIPSMEKIVLNMGIAEITKEKNAIQECVNELALISGQKPVVTKAKKAISNFKLRQGQPIGVKVTLRGKRMYDFMIRFFNIVSPRIRDFRGFNRKCNGRSYTLGIDDHQIFPELNLDDVKRTQGMDITFVTTAQTDKECVALLSHLGLPFKREG